MTVSLPLGLPGYNTCSWVKSQTWAQFLEPPTLPMWKAASSNRAFPHHTQPSGSCCGSLVSCKCGAEKLAHHHKGPEGWSRLGVY